MTTPALSGATDHYAIPYPTLTDRVTDGAAAIQATAEAVDGVLWGAASTIDTAAAAGVTAVQAQRTTALADVETARQAALADVASVSSSATAINARMDDLTALYWIGAI